MSSFRAFCDEFAITSRLFFKLQLDPSRETILNFFERVRKEFPAMSKLRRRDDGALVLEEGDDTAAARRHLRLDPGSLRFGHNNPDDTAEVTALARCVLTQAPPYLSLSELDTDHMEVVFNFDLEYRGNHDELVAETFFAEHPLLANLAGDGQRVIDCQPFWGISLTPDCDTQAYVEIRSRTSTFEVRTSEYDQSPLSVICTVRRYWGFRAAADLCEVHAELLKMGEQFATNRIVPHIVQPLAQAIASRH